VHYANRYVVLDADDFVAFVWFVLEQNRNPRRKLWDIGWQLDALHPPVLVGLAGIRIRAARLTAVPLVKIHERL
jgi:hypothetical protein